MATRTVANGGGNYNATGTWVEGAVPTSADDVVFTGTSGQLTVNVNSVCQSIDFTNYTNTFTMNANLTISGNVTLVSGFTFAGAASRLFIVNAAATLTSNGVTLPYTLNIIPTANITVMLADDWTVTGTGTIDIGALTTGFNVLTLNGNNLYINGGNFRPGSIASFIVTGTTTIVFKGGNSQWLTSNAFLKLSVSVDTTGSLTLASGTINYEGGTFTYVSGTVITTGNTLSVVAATTFNTNGCSFNNVTFGNTTTITLNSLLSVSNNLQINNGGIITFAGTAGFAVVNLLLNNITSNTITFKNGLTYTVSSLLRALNALPSTHLLLTSDSGSVQAILTLNNGAVCQVGYVNFTRIDASNGRTIRSFNGTIVQCSNVMSFTDIPTVVSGS